MRHFNGPSGRPANENFQHTTRRELNKIANEMIENAPTESSYAEYRANTRSEKTRLAWLDLTGKVMKNSPLNPREWGDDAFACDCRGLAWAIRQSSQGRQVFVAQDEDGYYFAFSAAERKAA